MIIKSVLLGIILFIFDLLIFGKTIFPKSQKKLSAKQLSVIKGKLNLTIPVVLFIQIFFGFLLVYIYKFGTIFGMFAKTIQGGLTFAIIIFLPMLYMLINTWLWGNKEDHKTLLPTICSWVAKFIFIGFYLGIVR